MTFVRRGDPDGTDRVQVSFREEGYVYFKRPSETSDKLDRLTEAEFEDRYVDEAALRLEETA